jgi:HEPN domain-containing protein
VSDSEKYPFQIGKLPNDVEAAVVSPDGSIRYIFKPYPVSNRWPDVYVDSRNFKDKSVAEKMYEQAKAFLNAATLCCEAAGEAAEKIQWSQGSVCYYCLNLATELFLKACISRATGDLPLATHSIPQLLSSYAEVLPNKEFHFSTPWAISASEIEEWVGSKVFEEIDRNPDQLYRYGVGRNGKSSAGIQMFSPGNFYDYAIHLSNVWGNAWSEASKNG